MYCPAGYLIHWTTSNLLKIRIAQYPPNVSFMRMPPIALWAGCRSRYSDWLRAGRSGDRTPVEARFSAPIQTGPGAHPASCTMGTGSFPGVKSSRGVTQTPHPLPVPWSWKGRAIPLLHLWAVRPVTSLSACTRVTFTFFTGILEYRCYILPLNFPLFIPPLEAKLLNSAYWNWRRLNRVVDISSIMQSTALLVFSYPVLHVRFELQLFLVLTKHMK